MLRPGRSARAHPPVRLRGPRPLRDCFPLGCGRRAVEEQGEPQARPAVALQGPRLLPEHEHSLLAQGPAALLAAVRALPPRCVVVLPRPPGAQGRNRRGGAHLPAQCELPAGRHPGHPSARLCHASALQAVDGAGAVRGGAPVPRGQGRLRRREAPAHREPPAGRDAPPSPDRHADHYGDPGAPPAGHAPPRGRHGVGLQPQHARPVPHQRRSLCGACRGVL
mmetsp:Transcript_23487/g.89230  ORF Transcript_23487/g.89230 Transcript_23487/m.89230 type:complete len:222 (+) Transcript_23487:11557-12222(+)